MNFMTERGNNLKEFKVELVKGLTEKDWEICKTVTLNTVGKKSLTSPTFEWKQKLLRSEHSPIRTLQFVIKMEIPYYVSVHFARHKIGVEHYVTTSRSDRTGVPRDKLPQDTMVSHMMYINAQELMNMARLRLCGQADTFTRMVMTDICKVIIIDSPEFNGLLEPKCVYRGGICDEFNPCGMIKRRENYGSNFNGKVGSWERHCYEGNGI